MRLLAADVAMIDRAAQLQGRSRTEFVRDAAVRVAEETLMENSLIRMSEADHAAFVEAITAPAAPVPAIVELSQRVWPPGSKPDPTLPSDDKWQAGTHVPTCHA